MSAISLSFITLLCTVLFLNHVDTSSSSRRNRHHRTQEFSRHLHDNELIPTSNEVDMDERLALQHNERVAEAGSCEVPKLHVIHVNDHYPGRYFLPHCTLLHRCGKHAGCCGTDRLRCAAEKKEKVTLHFYSVRIVGHGIPAERKIEKLTFTNHTKCGCVPVEHSSKYDL